MRRILLGAAVVLGAAGLYAAWALLPPDPLAVPERGVVLLGVTVIEPTERRLSETTLRIEGTRIAAEKSRAVEKLNEEELKLIAEIDDINKLVEQRSNELDAVKLECGGLSYADGLFD